MSIHILDASVRDATWIAANMRAIDRAEIMCQVPDELQMHTLVLAMLSPGGGYIAYEDERPVMVFGTTPFTVNAMVAWGFGTDHTPRVIPTVSRFLIKRHIPARIEQGFTIMEARSIATHGEAHRWFETLGGEKHGEAYEFGKGGEYFVSYRWTVSGYRAISRSRWAEAVPENYR